MKFFCLAKSEHFFSAEKRVSKYKNGAEKICGADFLFIDTDPYLKSDEEYLPDTAHYISIEKKERSEMLRGLSERYYFDEYRILKDKILDRISEGEDIVILVNGYILFAEHATNEQIRFFCKLKEFKPFNLHLIIPIYERFQSSDYHELLRTMNFVEDIKSVCFINERTLTNRRNNDRFDKRLERSVRAIKAINGDGFFIYDYERRKYLPCERSELQSEYNPYNSLKDGIFEYKTDNGNICEMMYNYREAFAQKHHLTYRTHPCNKCQNRKFCQNVCYDCDSSAERLWSVVYGDEKREYNEVSARINGVDRFRINTDGNGVRSLVLMAGCPLNCAYCGNKKNKDIFPDTQAINVSELGYYDHLRKDGIYFEMTDGGVTFGGGEPLLQAQFIHEFCRCYPMWSVNLETSLNVPLERMLAVVNDINYWYVDIKDMNPDIYLCYTGKPNTQVLANLAELIRLVPAERICVRVPLIKGYNSPVDVERSVNALSEMGFTNIERFEYVVE